jgi:hypothetical protein
MMSSASINPSPFLLVTDGDAPGAAYAVEFPGFQEAQQLGLGRGVQVPDLVEKQGALGGGLDQPRLGLARSAECAFFVREQLSLDQFGGDRRTVDRREGPLEVGALIVNGAGHQFLAGAGFSKNQHRGVRAFGHAPHEGHHPLDGCWRNRPACSTAAGGR